MLDIYHHSHGLLLPAGPGTGPEDLERAVWLDLLEPSDEERACVDGLLHRPLPESDDVEEIEATARFFEDEAGLHVHTLFFHETEGHPRNTSVAFTLHANRLVTLRDRDIPAFRLLRRRARRQLAPATDALDVLLSLFEIKLEHLADTLEDVHHGLEAISAQVLEPISKSQIGRPGKARGLRGAEFIRNK